MDPIAVLTKHLVAKRGFATCAGPGCECVIFPRRRWTLFCSNRCRFKAAEERKQRTRSRQVGRRRKYPWDALAVGDSFPIAGRQRRCPDALHRAGKRYEIRKADDGYRCWRVA